MSPIQIFIRDGNSINIKISSLVLIVRKGDDTSMNIERLGNRERDSGLKIKGWSIIVVLEDLWIFTGGLVLVKWGKEVELVSKADIRHK